MSKLPLYVFKVIIIGEPAVGKTSLVKQYVTDQFKDEYKSTMGANIYLKTVELEDGTKIKFTLWDIAGQRERFARMQNVYFQGAQGCIIFRPRRHGAWHHRPKRSREKHPPSASGRDLPPHLGQDRRTGPCGGAAQPGARVSP